MFLMTPYFFRPFSLSLSIPAKDDINNAIKKYFAKRRVRYVEFRLNSCLNGIEKEEAEEDFVVMSELVLRARIN